MKLLVVIPSLHRGGAERVVSLLSQEWVKKHDVKVAVFDSSSPAYPYGGELLDLELPALRKGLLKGLQGLRRVAGLVKLFNEVNPDRIISFMESANFPTILAALLTSKVNHIWVSVHNDPERFTKIYRILIPILYRFPGRVIGVSKGVCEALAVMGVPESKLRAIPNPVPPNSPPLTVTLPYPSNAPARYILAVGRLHRQKGFDFLIDAFAEIDDPNLNLVILGEGAERRALLAQAHERGISLRVHMPGAVGDVWPWYRHALCFVLSSRYEGWGNVILEAMSQGCLVVSFDCKYGPGEIIDNGTNGYLIEAGNIDLLRDTLQYILKNKAASNKCRKNGLFRCADFDVSTLARKWTEVI